MPNSSDSDKKSDPVKKLLGTISLDRYVFEHPQVVLDRMKQPPVLPTNEGRNEEKHK